MPVLKADDWQVIPSILKQVLKLLPSPDKRLNVLKDVHLKCETSSAGVVRSHRQSQTLYRWNG